LFTTTASVCTGTMALQPYKAQTSSLQGLCDQFGISQQTFYHYGGV
jgi:hypothetical protein